MLKVQHIGIPTADIGNTVRWYGELGFSPVFRTTLDDGVEVAFIDVEGMLLEFYTNPVAEARFSVIGPLHFGSALLKGEFRGPSGESLVFEEPGNRGLSLIELNSTSPRMTGDDLALHGFRFEEGLYRNGSVSLKVNDASGEKVAQGPVNHIAFDEKDLEGKYKEITSLNIPVVEGINHLPFFSNGVSYFVTENHDSLRLEYNCLL